MNLLAVIDSSSELKLAEESENIPKISQLSVKFYLERLTLFFLEIRGVADVMEPSYICCFSLGVLEIYAGSRCG